LLGAVSRGQVGSGHSNLPTFQPYRRELKRTDTDTAIDPFMDSAVIPTKEELSAHNPYTYEASLTLYYSILVEFLHTIIDPGSLSRMHIPLDLT